jgi:aspartate kinase
MFGRSHSPPTPTSRDRSGSSPHSSSFDGFTALVDRSDPEFNITIELIRQEHFSAAAEAIKDPDIRQELEDEVERDCEWLRNFLFASRVCIFPAIFT